MPRLCTTLIAAACLVGPIGLTACRTSPTAQTQAPLIESESLVRPLPVVLADALAARKQAGLALPEGYDSPQFTEAVVQTLLLQYPEAFLVTAEQEQQFQQGRFDERDAAREVSQLLEQVREHQVPLTTITAYLAARYETGTLRGVRLELARRLLREHLAAALADFDEPADAEQADEAATAQADGA